MKDETLNLILKEKNNRNTIIVATDIISGEQLIISENNDSEINNKISNEDMNEWEKASSMGIKLIWEIKFAIENTK